MNKSNDFKVENLKSLLYNPCILTRSEDAPPELQFHEQSYEVLVKQFLILKQILAININASDLTKDPSIFAPWKRNDIVEYPKGIQQY